MSHVAILDYPHARIQIESDLDAGSPREKQYRWFACEKEPMTVEFIESIPRGGVFWDIGANVGSYTLVAAARGLQVVAIEPVMPNYAALVRNLWLNKFDDQVWPLPVAVANGIGHAWISLPDIRSGSASSVWQYAPRGQRPGFGHGQRTFVATVDLLVELFHMPAPTHIKIDVDGAELHVLQGAQKTLASAALQGLMVELQPPAEGALVAYLADQGWQMAERWPIRGIAYGRFARAPVHEFSANGTASTAAATELATAVWVPRRRGRGAE